MVNGQEFQILMLSVDECFRGMVEDYAIEHQLSSNQIEGLVDLVNKLVADIKQDFIDEIDTLNDQIADLEFENDDLQDQIDFLDADNFDLQAQTEDLKAQLGEKND